MAAHHDNGQQVFPRDVLLYAIGASLLWLFISAGLIALEHYETDLMIRRSARFPQLPDRDREILQGLLDERNARQDAVHAGLWVLVQAGLAAVSVRMGKRVRERRAARAQLQEATSRLDALIHQPALGYIHIDRGGRIAEVNDPWLAMHRYHDRADALGSVYSFDHMGISYPHTLSIHDAVKSGQLPPVGEAMHRWPDGSRTYHTYSLHPVGVNGTSNGVEGFIVDITEQKLAEEERDRSEQRYRALFENHIAGCALHEMIFDEGGAPVDYRFLEINTAFEVMLGLDRSAVVGKSVSEVFPGLEKEWIERYGQVVTSGRPTHFEMWSESLNRWFEVQAFCAAPGQFAVLFMDITERLATSATLTRSLGEKSALLKELHHRVKNNLQVLSSLINLHSSVLGDPAARELLKTYQRRIRSMALVHETMYGNDDLSHIDFGEYLHAAITELRQSFHLGHIECRIDAGIQLLDISTAIPCGMVVSELVTNAMRYAFHQRDHGVLSVTLRRYKDCAEILITDDGVGFVVPERRRMGTTVGLFLVDVLMEQLGGTLEITSGSSGTRCRLLVPSVPDRSIDQGDAAFDDVSHDLCGRCQARLEGDARAVSVHRGRAE